ncbi:hypothetical protein LTR78_007680 [Recurvomyces mirabilis]|uniref:UFSP1/2/DUB catalytic domain-containing protein n=1 Tax=Recurvomyces mirabilis TaxID=574656 RepID=A0AAE0TSL5_9PEZI|nr:hypothetical protein LTR78_007680 [Recurvomyces mirabilis]KAK5151567.1 hypothetical protein LTS14_009054 [Recurvomyces mirabilis]
MDDHEIKRLGQKRDLGPHAFEDHMPEHIHTLLAAEDHSNDLPNVIPKLAQLLHHDKKVAVAYLCYQGVVQIHKLPDEGPHFCGYRNLQMICLSLATNTSVSIKAEVQQDLGRKLTVLGLQDRIEAAWDRGFNPHGRIQTGGIRGARKHIGSSEAEALLLSMGVECTGSAFTGSTAWSDLLNFVEKYFNPSPTDFSSGQQANVHITDRPPLFLQRPQHSITIVGIERLASGKRRLFVFDPAWKPPATMRKAQLDDADLKGWRRKYVFGMYRKGERYLRKWNEFEVVSVQCTNDTA